MVIKFNKKWAKEVGKTKFIAHFKNIYKDLDLSAEYEKLFNKQSKKK